MRDFLLLLIVAAFFIVGYFFMKRVDRYIGFFHKAVKKEYELPLTVEEDREEDLPKTPERKPSYVIITGKRTAETPPQYVIVHTGKQ